MRRAFLFLVLSTGCAAPQAQRLVSEPPTIWNFDDPAAGLRASTGTAVLEYYDPGGTGWGPRDTRFQTTRELGLPDIEGKEARVMLFPAAAAGQGYALRHGAAPNGVFAAEGRVSNYTLVMDIFWPPGKPSKYRALFQTDPDNKDDADLFYLTGPGGGLGISGRYEGAVDVGRWHRIAVAVQSAVGLGGVGQIQKYVDGAFVGGHNTPGGSGISRWALGPRMLLLTDNDGAAAEGALAGLLFAPRMMSPEELYALGGPHAAGPSTAGRVPPVASPAAPRRTAVIGHRGNGCCAPENTLASIRAAFERGANHAEVDVQISADGVAFLMHDAAVDRTTDGSGNASAMTLRALKKLDAGGWFDPRFQGERIPTLAEALLAAKGRGRLLLDVKDPGMGKAISAALAEAGVGPKAIWVAQSVNVQAAADFKASIPGVEILWGVVPDADDLQAFSELKAAGVAGFEIAFSKLDEKAVGAAHRHGMPVYTYTLFDRESMLKAIGWGVDGIETDYPEMLKGLLP